MSTKTTSVQVTKNQNNSKELFEQWNNKKQTNIICSCTECSIDVENNAYIVVKLNANRKFILPLCKECYSMATSNIKNSPDIIDLGSILIIEENLLMKYSSRP